MGGTQEKILIAAIEKKGYCKGKGAMRVSTTGKRYTQREKGESRNLQLMAHGQFHWEAIWSCAERGEI